ncbi:hypothetical protein K525DRAFT_208088 [Schizophyllum commune Loenen D]|nr:hypothetical protein K525DRAFT_208088 [Schizophyllum commune Loenen D]
MPRLPEEILNRVLADVLDIPDHEFYNNVTDLRINAGARWAWAPGKEYLRHEDRRPPALLRVCKAWRRIGNPHLYHSIFIRTQGQADALATTLTIVRPDLAAYIRRLRPSAGRGPAMYKILRSTTQLSVLTLDLFARVDEDIGGLISGLALPHINPNELRILCDHDYDVSKRMALIGTLIYAFPTWTNLKNAHIDWELSFRGTQGNQFVALVRGLATAPSLATVALPHELSNANMIPALRILASNHSITLLNMSRPCDLYNPFDRAVFEDPRLRAVCKYREPGTYHEPEHLSDKSIQIQRLAQQYLQNRKRETNFKLVCAHIAASPWKNNMSKHPVEVQEKVWSNVLGIAIHELHVGIAGTLSLTRRLLLPGLYTSITADGGVKSFALTRAFYLNSTLGQYVKELRLANRLSNNLFVPVAYALYSSPHLRLLSALGWQSDRYGKNFPLQLEWEEFTNLAACAPELEAVYGVKILKDAPKEVSGILGYTPSVASYLHRALQPTDDLSVPLGDLTPFGSLRSLTLIVPVVLEFEGTAVRSDVFPILEDLSLHDCHTSVLRLFSLFELPRLRVVELGGSALRATDASLLLWRHGSKIEELDLEYFPTSAIFGFCRGLKVLKIQQELLHPEDSAAGWQSGSLERLVCDGITSNEATIARWGEVYQSIDSSRLPRLKVVRTWLAWPTDE